MLILCVAILVLTSPAQAEQKKELNLIVCPLKADAVAIAKTIITGAEKQKTVFKKIVPKEGETEKQVPRCGIAIGFTILMLGRPVYPFNEKDASRAVVFKLSAAALRQGYAVVFSGEAPLLVGIRTKK